MLLTLRGQHWPWLVPSLRAGCSCPEPASKRVLRVIGAWLSVRGKDRGVWRLGRASAMSRLHAAPGAGVTQLTSCATRSQSYSLRSCVSLGAHGVCAMSFRKPRCKVWVLCVWSLAWCGCGQCIPRPTWLTPYVRRVWKNGQTLAWWQVEKHPPGVLSAPPTAHPLTCCSSYWTRA